MTKNPSHAPAWRHPSVTQMSLCLALLASACMETPPVSGTGGGAASTGGSGSGGATGTGTGGAVSTGGSASGGATGTSSGGATATGGRTSSGGSPSGGATAGSGGAPRTGGTTGTGGILGTGGRGGSGSGGAAGGSTGTGGATPGTPGRSAGCGKTSTITFGTVPGESGSTVGTGKGGYVKIGNRGFAMRLPDNYDNNKPYWLIFGFHWNGGNSKEVDSGGTNGYNMAHFGLQKLSKNGAIFVGPDGTGGGWANSGGADLKFVDDMVKLIEDNYCVDTTHLFANGFSYGGGMSYAIACARAKVFRGIAIYDGAVLSGCEGGTDPIAYWQMAGLTDTTCTVAAGVSMRDKFLKLNGCTAQAEPPRPPQPPPYLATGGHVCTNYAGCSSGHPVRWCVHQSGHGNAVVDGTSDLYNSCATPPKTCSSTCPCTWVPEDVWTWMNSL